MSSSHLFHELRDHIGSNSFENVEHFVFTFMRFEFTLVEIGEIRNNKPNWSYFNNIVSAIDWNNAELIQSRDYLINTPPQKKDLNNNTWVAVNVTGLSVEEILIKYIKTIRNNLLHGSKTPFNVARDTILIKSCLVILDKILDISPNNFKTKFWENLNEP
jgi:hypothetical protein